MKINCKQVITIKAQVKLVVNVIDVNNVNVSRAVWVEEEGTLNCNHRN